MMDPDGRRGFQAPVNRRGYLQSAAGIRMSEVRRNRAGNGGVVSVALARVFGVVAQGMSIWLVGIESQIGVKQDRFATQALRPYNHATFVPHSRYPPRPI